MYSDENENAPTGESRQFLAVSYMENVSSFMLAIGAIKFNLFARCYV